MTKTEKDQRDARRYRLLRSTTPMDDITVEASGKDGVYHLSGRELDRRLDRALRIAHSATGES